VGHNQSLCLPEGLANDSFDYEGEIAIVIGKKGFKIAQENAMDHIFGYTLFNDGSVRDWQKHSIHSGKNFYHSSSCGPYIVTKDQVKNFSDLHLQTRLNGKVVQSSSTKNMFFNLNEILSYISNTIPLRTGDIIATGSPEGTGASQNPPRFLKKDDVLEFSAPGLGVLKNTIK
jgi:2-keto-4-pentenoate hydratase/2-oxohepta-3-ene-1,7-dioic acid hydratase in catechol pathway